MKAFLDELKDMELPDAEKLALAFGKASKSFIDSAERDRELARAMKDEDEVVVQNIKIGTMKAARGMIHGAFMHLSGKRRRLWDE